MIRKMTLSDREDYLRLSRDFYLSPAVVHSVPDSYREASFDELVNSDRYLDGYILEYDNIVAGYALVAKSFSTEAGGPVWWIEELYVAPNFRSSGLGREFFLFLQKAADGVARLRLEVEPDNIDALRLYHRLGFTELSYMQLIKDK